MNKLQEFVSHFGDEEIAQMIKDYEELEDKGAIGDCLLRRKAKEVIEQFGAESHQVVLWMDRIMFEIFRRLAYEHLAYLSVK